MVTTLSRAELLADTTLRGGAWCRAFSAATDAWLTELFERAARSPTHQGIALVAVGGYGRGELAPHSDLDVVLLHEPKRNVAEEAERLWYPLWDAKVKLGHAVRTLKEAISLAGDDLDTATSLLTVRHLAGDPRLTEDLRQKSLDLWHKRAKKWLHALEQRVELRHEQAGEVAFMLEPDLKEGRGGLRDVHALAWASATEVVSLPIDESAVVSAYESLLSVRVELHRRTGRPGDVLALQEQDGVADALGFADADALMKVVASAARTIAWSSDEAWYRISTALQGPAGREVRRDHHVAPGVFVREGEVHLDAGADPRTDPALCLRVATAAAHYDARMATTTLERLAAETPVFPDPWPAGAVDELAGLLLEGRRAIPSIEALDQKDLLVRILPEWAPNRNKPQRNAYHRFTVDRHLLEAAANAAELAPKVSRPDLLVIGTLFHDIGKGYPGDHTVVGMELVRRIAPRLGFGPDDVEVLVAMVEHHLLLPDIATRRDLSDDGTISLVAEAVGSATTLELLHALTVADSLATGPGAWGEWKAALVEELVERTAHVLGGGAMHEMAWRLFPDAETLALMGARRTTLVGVDGRLTVVAPDRPGLFSKVAGVLSLHGVAVLGAQAHSDEQGMAASQFVCAPGREAVRWDRVIADLERALDGRLALEARLAERVRTYRRRKQSSATPAARTVTFDNHISSNATVVEVRAPDGVGVLYRITRALADMGLDIRHAKVQTLGHEVVDSFYVRDATGAKVTDDAHLAELEREILFELSKV